MAEEIKNNTKIISEIQNRIQFGTMIAIFFSGMLYYFFNIFDKDNANYVTLSYSGVVAFYLVTFCLFELEKKKMNMKLLKWINRLSLLGIFLFIIPISYLTSINPKFTFIKVSLGFQKILFVISLYGLFLIPIVLFIILLIHLLIRLGKEAIT